MTYTLGCPNCAEGDLLHTSIRIEHQSNGSVVDSCAKCDRVLAVHAPFELPPDPIKHAPPPMSQAPEGVPLGAVPIKPTTRLAWQDWLYLLATIAIVALFVAVVLFA